MPIQCTRGECQLTIQPFQGPSRTTDPASGKRDLRRRVLSARDALTDAERARLSEAVCARAASLPELDAAGTVLSFASFRSEIETSSLNRRILGDGKALCLPRVVGPQRMIAARVHDLEIDLEPGAWGIPEPVPGHPEVDPSELDLVIVPGAAFDAAGRRCGYGGGFYDTYLQGTRAGVPRVALAFEAQIVLELPCEPHDLAVTAIVTEERVIRPA